MTRNDRADRNVEEHATRNKNVKNAFSLSLSLELFNSKNFFIGRWRDEFKSDLNTTH
jgi:hypothetical protein